ncbi:MAG: acyl-CoA dehydrogenase family protein [Chloroflexota bacterium]|nr:acyl-CoA dehydrogenase family protein [Chloroflexota bacterium]
MIQLTEEQWLLRDAVLQFARGELASVDGRDGDGHFAREAWRRCAELGLQGLAVPPEYGGTGASAVTIALALEALGYGCPDNGLIFSLGAQMWACETPIVRFGSEHQKRRYLPGLCDGSLIAAHGMSEPGSGSDAFSLRTRAERRDDRFVLTGTKVFVTNAPQADLFLIFATIDPALRFAGISAFLVEHGTPGLAVGPPAQKMGLEGAPMAELILDGCEVPADQVLGRPGNGMAIFNASMQWERGFILASCVGTMQRQLERCIEHARQREQFAQPIAAFQAVSHRIADMKVRLETARALLYRFAWLTDRGEADPLDAAITKLHLSETFLKSSLDALQLHGGYGYMVDYGLEQQVRDAVAGRLYSGTSDVQRNVIAHGLGL